MVSDGHAERLRVAAVTRGDLPGRVLRDLLGRADRAAATPYAEEYDAFVSRLDPDEPMADSWVRAAILGNLLGLVCFHDPSDYDATVALVEAHGHRRVAVIHNQLDRWLGTGPALPLTTEGVRQLLLGVVEERVDPDVAKVAERAGFLLLLEEEAPAAARILATEVSDLERVWSSDVRAWRGFCAEIGANPWRPYVAQVQELAREAGLPVLADAVATCSRIYKERREKEERAAIARQIRAAITASGCSQREFAQLVGTSASRLSTYVTGRVTPSAAMMLRINRTARALGSARDREARLPA